MKIDGVTKSFVRCSLGVAGAIVVFGWLTDAKMFVGTGLVTVAIVAFLPFLILALIFLVPVVVFVVCAVFGMLAALLTGDTVGVEDAAEPLLEGAIEGVASASGIVPWYYRILARQRHPCFWGTLCGLILGSGSLAALVAIFILPGEARTVQILARTEAELGRAYKASGSYPKPDENGHLSVSELEKQTEGWPTAGVILDGFGHPLRYEVKGHWKMASYRLTSLGYDGRPSADDFCVASSTRLATLAKASSELFEVLREMKGGKKATMQDKLRGIQALRRIASDEQRDAER